MDYNSWYRTDSEECVEFLLGKLDQYNTNKDLILSTAKEIALQSNEQTSKFSTARLLHKYKLNSPEGTALLGLAEAFMRIPDKNTKRLFLKDKLNNRNWRGHDFPMLTSALVIGGKIGSGIGSLVALPAINKALGIFGKQFVLGQTIKEALKNKKGLISCDMLGEAALTEEDAQRYFDLYRQAIEALPNNNKAIYEGESISVKLSALDPKFDYQYADYVVPRLIKKMDALTKLAWSKRISITIDAEEADKLDITLGVLKGTMLGGYPNLGIAVQAYQKRAYAVIEYLSELAEERKINLAVRLVKGAYWDSEIKWAQEQGLDYPVFTIKEISDLSYIACTEKILSCSRLYGQFATHNIHTIATVLELSKDKDFEIQRLHGMGEEVFDVVESVYKARCRVYAPVGEYKELLPYLVRRMLENGANTSFVSTFVNDKTVMIDPISKLNHKQKFDHSSIPHPRHMYKDRLNSAGLDLSDKQISDKVISHVKKFTLPTNPKDFIPDLDLSIKGQKIWSETELEVRIKKLEKVADLMEDKIYNLIALCVKEAHKTIPDSISEIREAIDFLRYYSEQARRTLKPTIMISVTGEENTLSYEPRGLWLAISPWNFPVAIFTGQIAAALVCGNAVVTKPAEQTQRIAQYVVSLFHKAGIDKKVLQLAFGDGTTGQKLVSDERFAGISFTGGTDTAKIIATTQLEREVPLGKLVAETGGINAMIVDSTALPEQVVNDALYSAFNSAGQRCSALRILCVQEEIYNRVLEMLKGGLKQLFVGDPIQLQTDVGPIIDNKAFKNIVKKSGINKSSDTNIFSPEIIEISSISDVKEEIFGPVLHILKWKFQDLDNLVNDLNGLNFNLTLGIHSRIEARFNDLSKRIRAGNVYINRNQVGAVVESQPFGGSGFSGTGPKAGGPNYLKSFVVEKTVSNNTTAIGGNTSLVMLQ